MALRKLTQEDILAVSAYVAENATIMTNDKGKEFIGLKGFNHEINGLEGRLNFGYFGLKDAGTPAEVAERATKTADAAVAKMTPEAKRALADKLLSEID